MSESGTGLCVPMKGERCEGMALALHGRNGGRGFDKIRTIDAARTKLATVVVYRCDRASLPMTVHFCPWCGASYREATDAAIGPRVDERPEARP